jgi:hypothetical protein
MIAPQKVIEGIKKQIDNIKKDNEVFTSIIEKNDQKFHVTQKNTNDFKKKSLQAKSDKVELMRDLATYESNFGDRVMMKERLS